MSVAGLGLLGGFLGAVVILAVRVLGSLVVDEVKGAVTDRGRRSLIQAAERLPTDQRGRWRDEWLAEYESMRDRRLKALLWALSIRRNVRDQVAALGIEIEPATRRERRRARSEARRQADAARVREALQGDVDHAIHSVFGAGASGWRRLAMLGAVSRRGDFGRIAVARAAAARVGFAVPVRAAGRAGFVAGTAVGMAGRVAIRTVWQMAAGAERAMDLVFVGVARAMNLLLVGTSRFMRVGEGVPADRFAFWITALAATVGAALGVVSGLRLLGL